MNTSVVLQNKDDPFAIKKEEERNRLQVIGFSESIKEILCFFHHKTAKFTTCIQNAAVTENKSVFTCSTENVAHKAKNGEIL